MDPTWLELERARRSGALPDDAYGRIVALTSADPEPATWRTHLDRGTLSFGAALLLAGVIYLVAFNWAELGHFTRLSLTGFAFVAAATVGFALGEARLAGKVALGSASVLIGPMLVVYSQAYQTGADPWTLFATWAALAVPWAIVARLNAAWAFVLGLTQVALSLFWTQHFGASSAALVLALAAVTALAWGLWAHFADPHGWARVAATWFFALLGVGAAIAVWELREVMNVSLVSTLLLAVALTQGRYWPNARDPYLVAVSGGALIAWSTSAIGRLLADSTTDSTGAFFVLGFWLAGSSIGLAMWIRAGIGGGRDV